eukprot:XP_011683518.1 PREDICTED: uncharacterized protein LOC105447323 [Strongylocentrotus purpuratus]
MARSTPPEPMQDLKQKPICADKTRTSHLESKHRGRPKKHTNAPPTVTGVLRNRGRPQKCKNALQTIPTSVSTLAEPMNRGRPKKHTSVPQTVTGVLRNRGRPKKCKNALQTIPTSVSTLAEPMNRCSSPKQKDGMTAPLSKSKHGVKPMLVSSLTPANPKLRVRGRPKKCKDASQTVGLPVSLSPLTEPRHKGQSKKCKDAHKVAPDSATGAETKRLGRPKKSSQAQETKSASVTISPTCKCHSQRKKSQVAPKGGAINTQSSSQSKTKSLRSENVNQPTKCFNSLRKQCKSGLLSSKQDLLKSVEPNQLRVLPSVNPDFSIDDNDSCMMNISEYLAQLGTYLEFTDCHDTTIVGNVNGPEEGSCDVNNNVITDSEILQKNGAGQLQSDSGFSDERTTFCMRLDPGEGSCAEGGYQKTDANNNLITNTDTHQKSETGTRPSDSGDIIDVTASTGISYDTIKVSKSKRSRRTQKENAQTSSICLNLRRSERLRLKENYRRCEKLWKDDGNCSQAGRNSMDSLSGRGSSCNQQQTKTSLDDDLLQEFVAMCPLEGDILFSDEECLSLLAGSPIFTGNAIGSPSRFAMLDDKEMGSQTVDVIRPRTPPKVRRSFSEFLLDEGSLHLLASQPIHYPPQHSPGSDEGSLQELCGISAGAWRTCPGSGEGYLQECGISPGAWRTCPGSGEGSLQECGPFAAGAWPTCPGSGEGSLQECGLFAAGAWQTCPGSGEGSLQECGLFAAGARQTCPGSCKDSLQECGISAGAWRTCPGFGPLMDCQVALLRQLGLDATEDLTRNRDNLRDVGRSAGIPDVSQCTALSSQDGDIINQDLERRDLQNMQQRKKSLSKKYQRLGAQESLKLPHHEGPLVVIPCPHSGGQKNVFAAAEVWLPSRVVESNTGNVFMPMGEWSAKERWWHVQKILWRNGLDGSWQVSEAQEELTIGTCFIPEEAWLVSQAARDKRGGRIYHVGLMPKGPGVHECPGPLNPSNASCHSLEYEKQRKATRKNRKKRQRHSIPIPGNPPPVGVHGFLQSRTAFHPSDPCPQAVTTPFGIGLFPNMIFSCGVQDPRPRLIPVFNQQQQPRVFETPLGVHGFLQSRTALHPSNPCPQIVTTPFGIGHIPNMISSCCVQVDPRPRLIPVFDQQLEPRAFETSAAPSVLLHHYLSEQIPQGVFQYQNSNIENSNGTTHQFTKGHSTGLEGYMAVSHDHNYYAPSEIMAWERTPLLTENTDATCDGCGHDCGENLQEMVSSGQAKGTTLLQSEHHFEMEEIVFKTPSTLSEALELIEVCEDVAILGKVLLEWCKSGNHVPEYEDECVLVQLGLSVVSQFLAKDQQQQAHQNQPKPVQDQSGPAETQNQAMQVQDQSGPAETQNQAMEVQDPPSPLVHPREDAYCILQMLLHLTLPLTEVLASLPEASPRDPSLGLLERVDSSTVRDVLGVLADFDPAMAFTVIQGLGWGHTVLEVSREKEAFGQQLIALAEALLDCEKFWQCRVLLSHLLAYEGCRQPCRLLYSSLLGKLLDTETDCEQAMMVFEDMMESYLIIPAPILSKLLTLMWKRRVDGDSLEDALCVFHYGLGLRIYPMYKKVEDTDVWEATVLVGATDAEVFFCLKTLLDEVHHQQGGQLEGVGQRGGRERRSGVVQDAGRELVRGESVRYAGNGRCGARKQSAHQGIPRVNLKKKGRTVPLARYDLQKHPPRNLTGARGHTIVNIKLMESLQANQDGTRTEEGFSADGFSRILTTKDTVRSVLANHFHPLTIRPGAPRRNSCTRKDSYTLTISDDTLQSWLVAKARETTCVVID